MTNKKYPQQQIKVNGEWITYHKIDYDLNGNPRYVVHFLSLNVQPKDYGKIPGLKKYRAKWFGGGYVIQSYNLEQDLEFQMDLVSKWYDRKERGLNF